MGRIEKTVFISYRRANVPWALAIFQYLTHNGYDVFFDFNGIASGDFERVILGNIEARAHFLVLLTPSALEKCDRDGDWLRREIETAIELKRNVVPLMLDAFDFNAPGINEQLTGPMATLKSYNALRVPPEYFEEAMGRLRDKFLNVPLEGVLQPVPPAARQVARDQQTAAKAEPAVQEEELTAQAYFERAFQATDHDEKLRFYTQAIRLKPDYVAAFYNRAIGRKAQGDLAGAREDYDAAIRLKPDHAHAFFNRGGVRKDQGDLAGALEDYDVYMRLAPDDPDAFLGRASTRRQQRDLAGAREDADAAVRLKPDYANAFFHRAVTRGDQGDLAGAREDYDAAIRLKPDYANAFFNRGSMRRKQGDLPGALGDVDVYIRLSPSDGDGFFLRSLVRRDQGDLAGARNDWKAAKRLNPKLTGDLPDA